MKPRFARCWNQDYCMLAHSRTLLCVDEGALFVCPECARPLRPAAAPTPSRRRALIRAGGMALALLISGFLAWRYELPLITITKPQRLAQAMLPPTQPPPARKPAAPAPSPPVPVTPPSPAAPPPPAEAPSIVLRLRGDPALAAVLLPQLAKGFLESSGDADVAIRRDGSLTDVRGHGTAGVEAITILATPAENAFTALADGGTEIVFAVRPPNAMERHVLGRVESQPVAATPGGAAALYVPLPADPTAGAFLEFARSAPGRALLAEAGFSGPRSAKPSARPPAPPRPMPKPPATPSPPAPTPLPPVAAATPAATPPEPGAQLAGAAPEDTPPATPRIVHLPAGSKITFGPLKDVEMPSEQTRMIFLPQSTAPQAPGKMQVDCLIQTSGVPRDCHQVSATGAGQVSGAILAWLGSGAIRYGAAEKNGRKVEERRLLTVNFRQPTASP
jgi:hypothetical protein